MLTNETRSQDSTVIIITGDDAKIIDDTPDWEGPLIEYNRCDEPIRHSYAWCSVYGAEILDGEMSTVSHRSICRYE